MMRRRTLLLSILLTACGGDDGGASSDTSGTTAGTETEASSAGTSAGQTDSASATTGAGTTGASRGSTGGSAGSSSAGSTGGGSTGGGSTGGGTDTGGATGEVRFIAMGDAGEGNTAQYEVASAVEMVCAARGCDFVVYLGDNFYDNGVSSVMDQQFQDKFELPYMDLDLQFYIALGNHDYGEISNQWEKSDWEIEYTQYSDKWYLPSEWYTFEAEHVQFFVMDTTRLMWDHQTVEQQAWLDAEMQASTATWKIAAAHHPYISNGAHGNAGNYEGFPFPDLVAGTTVKEVLDESVCGKADVYLCGHDHNRQALMPACGTEFFVSGAGAKTTAFEHHDNNPVFYEDDTTPGFLWVEIVDKTMTAAFYDKDGNMDFERQITKP